MRITKVRTFLVNAKMRNWLFVRVETDTPGLYGLARQPWSSNQLP